MGGGLKSVWVTGVQGTESGEAGGVWAQYSSGLLLSNLTVGSIAAGDGPSQSGVLGAKANGILMTGSTGSTIQGCSVSSVAAGRGGTGHNGSGGAGGFACGSRSETTSAIVLAGNTIDGISGGDGGGSGGYHGRTGGNGGIGAGLCLESTSTATIEGNGFTLLSGGIGASGSPIGAQGLDQQGFGIYFFDDGSLLNSFAMDNTVDGDPLVVLSGHDDAEVVGLSLTATSNPTNLGKIVVVASTGVVLKQNLIAGLTGEAAERCEDCTAPPIAGVWISDSEGVTILDNSITEITGGSGGPGPDLEKTGGEGGLAAGVMLSAASGCQIHDNSIGNIAGGSGGQGGGNGVGGTGGVGAGIGFESSSGNELTGNLIEDVLGGSGGLPGGISGPGQEGYGFHISEDSLDNHSALTNTMEGQPIVFVSGQEDVLLSDLSLDLPGNSTNMGKMVVVNSHNVVVESSTISLHCGESGGPVPPLPEADGRAGVGVLLRGCSSCVLDGLTVSGINGGGGSPRTHGTQGNKTGNGGNGVGVWILDSLNTTVRVAVRDIVGGDKGPSGSGNGGAAIGVMVASSPASKLNGTLVTGLTTGYGSDISETACVTVVDSVGISVAGLTCTLSQNQQDAVGHGVWLGSSQPGPVQLLDSIFTNISGYCLYNHDDNAPTLLTAAYSNLHECGLGQAHNATVAASCISDDPLFVDPDNGDFHLQPESPCIDAGKPSSEYENEPAPNGCRVNMGAYGNTEEATSKEGTQHCE